MMRVSAILATALLFCGALSAQAAIYVKADATGDNNGASWADAYTSPFDAIAAATGEGADRTIFIAQGVYYINNEYTLPDAIKIYGGFKGDETGTEEEMLAARDCDEYQTIISADSNKNDKWERFNHTADEWEYPVAEKLGLPIIDPETKKVNIPAFTGDFDTYDFLIDYSNFRQKNWFIVAAGQSATFDGLWFTSNWGGWGGTINVKGGADQTVPCYVRNCRFVGLRAYGYTESSHANCDNYLIGCKFFGACTAPIAFSSSLVIQDCEISGVQLGGDNYGGVIRANGSGATITGCTFTHCVQKNTHASNRTAVLFGGQWGCCDMKESVASNCLAFATSTGKIGLFGCGNSVVEKCLFVNNRENVRVSGGAAYSMTVAANGRATAHDDPLVIDGCTFVSNTLHAAALDGGTAGECALGIVGSFGYTKNYTAVVNASFYDNVVEMEPSETVTALKSRGVLEDATVGNMGSLGVVNCAFGGAAQAGVYDVVQFGTANSRPFNIVNSIFTSDAAVADPFSFSLPSVVTLESCTVKHGVSPAGAVVSNFSAQEVPLELFAPESGCALALRPTVKTPELRSSADVGIVSSAKLSRTYAFKKNGADAWTALLTYQSTATTVTAPLDDATGAVREYGTMTRGAMQALSSDVESGVSFTILCSPLTAGTIGGIGAVQAVQPGAAPVSVPAVPNEGMSFEGWFEVGAETPFSTETDLDYDAISDHKTIEAHFGTPTVDLTFDLGDGGTFVENGAAVVIKQVAGGTTPVPVPAYVLDENRIDLGWTPSTNDASPMVATTYSLKSVSKDVRTVYVVPGGAGNKDGTSWENAYGDLAEAWADAGIYRGVVEAKGGTYAISKAFDALGNVTLKGGVDGVKTVIRGTDVGYLLYASAESAVTNVWFENVTFEDFRSGVANLVEYTASQIRFVDCVFTNNNTVRDGTVVRTKGSVTFENCQMLSNFHFFHGSGATGTFSGCLFDSNLGERDGGACIAFQGGNGSITNCVFRNNRCTTNYDWSQACILLYTTSSSTISDCLFEGNIADRFCDGIVWTGGTVERCRFIGNKGTPNKSCRVTAGVNLGGDALVRDCLFASNVVTAVKTESGKSYNYAPAVMHVNGRSSVINCSFVDNRVEGEVDALDDVGVVAAEIGNWANGLGIAHCSFRGNSLDVTGSERKGAINAGSWSADTDGGIGIANCAVARTVGAPALYVKEGKEASVFTSALFGWDENPEPEFLDKLAEADGLPPQLRLTGFSPDPYIRGGTLVYLNGWIACVYAPDVDAAKPYITLPSPVSHNASPTAEVVPVPDAFGAVRKVRKIAFGAVNPLPRGLMIQVR